MRALLSVSEQLFVWIFITLCHLEQPQPEHHPSTGHRLEDLTFQVPRHLLLALEALPGPTVLDGETHPQSFSPSSGCKWGGEPARELRDAARTDDQLGASLPATLARTPPALQLRGST